MSAIVDLVLVPADADLEDLREVLSDPAPARGKAGRLAASMKPGLLALPPAVTSDH